MPDIPDIPDVPDIPDMTDIPYLPDTRNVDVIFSLLIDGYNMEQLCSSVVSIQEFGEEIWVLNPHRLQKRIYTFDIFTNH